MWAAWWLVACSGGASAPLAVESPAPEPAQVVPEPSWPEGVRRVDCETTLLALGVAEGDSLRVGCPAGCSSRVYGTDRYTPDSSVCTAAMHIGIEGGVVTLDVLGVADRFVGSTRSGITTESWTTPIGPTLSVRR